MGSFNHKCNFSQLPAKYGDRIVILVGVQIVNNVLSIDSFSPGKSFTPVSVPIRGQYNDYGGIMNVDRTPGIDALEKFFGMGVEQIVDCAERNMCGCKNQVIDDCNQIMSSIDFSNNHNDDIIFAYIMEHEYVFDKMLSMNDIAVKDHYYWTIPHEYIEELGYSKNVIGNENGYDIVIWSHPSLPELKEKCYIWKTEDFDDYRKVCNTLSDLCKYIGCEIPEKFNERYYESRFRSDIEFIAEKERNPKDIKYIYTHSQSEKEYSFIRNATYGLFSGYNHTIPSRHLICTLGSNDEHLKSEYMKEIIEVALLYDTLYNLQMTWNNTNYYRQDIMIDEHIKFLEFCLETAKQKKKEMDDAINNELM